VNIRKSSYAAAVAATLALATPANAAGSMIGYYYDGNALLQMCVQPLGSIEQASCNGYIVGVADMASGMVSRRGQIGFVVPDGVTIGQLRDVVVRHLTSHPETRHGLATDCVWSALLNAFPTPAS
jgi:Rap1a immunity proteins